jgi:hypothetical protein
MLNAMIHSEAVIYNWIYYLHTSNISLLPVTHKLRFNQLVAHMVNCMYEWRRHLHISQPTIFLFFKKLTGSGCLLVTSILWNIWCAIFLLSRGSSFSFNIRKFTRRPESMKKPAFSTWINEETSVSTLPSTDSCEIKCFALVLLFKFMSTKSENVTNFYCYRGHWPQYCHKHFEGSRTYQLISLLSTLR